MTAGIVRTSNGPIDEFARPSGRARGACFALIAAILLFAGCNPGESDAPAAPAPGATLRAVSLAPLATRLTLAVGAQTALVAVDAASASRHPELRDLPVVDLAGALRLAPDLLLLAELPEPPPPGLAALQRRGSRTVEFAPHDLEDAIALVREVAGALVGAERAGAFEAAFSRPLAMVGGSSHGRTRPRVVAVASLDPLVIAGGHSFETDLIEIAGGHSVTHPGEEHRVAIGADAWQELAPDLVLVLGEPPGSSERARAVRNALPPDARVAYFDYDPAFWLGAANSAEPARRLRALIEPLSHPIPR